jgi:peptidoglycan/LPS O-acetylase OafA/YrhL
MRRLAEEAHLVSLDGLRGLLALFVVIGHCSIFFPAQGEGLTLLAHGFRLPAFFALSGFVLYLSSADRERVEMTTPFSTYLSRRLRRLYPPYVTALVVFTLLTGAVVLSGMAKPGVLLPRANESLLVHLFYLQSWQPDFDLKFGLLSQTWMLGYELQLALLLPVFLAIVRRIGWGGLLLLGLCLCHPAAQRWNQSPAGQYLFYPSFTVSFLLGLAAVRLVKAPPPAEDAQQPGRVLYHYRVHLCLGTAIAALTAHLLVFFGVGSSVWSEVCAGVSVAAFCAFLALRPVALVGRVLSSRPLVFLGTLSYSLFLVHAPLLRFAQFALGHWHIASEGNYLALAVMLPIILVGAMLFYRYCERPWIEQRFTVRLSSKAIANRLAPT